MLVKKRRGWLAAPTLAVLVGGGAVLEMNAQSFGQLALGLGALILGLALAGSYGLCSLLRVGGNAAGARAEPPTGEGGGSPEQAVQPLAPADVSLARQLSYGSEVLLHNWQQLAEDALIGMMKERRQARHMPGERELEAQLDETLDVIGRRVRARLGWQAARVEPPRPLPARGVGNLHGS